MESNIQEIATNIGFMLDNFASRLVEKLPATLARENAHLFLRAFEDIETLTQSGYETAQKVGDEVLDYGAERMLVPFHHLTLEWCNAYTSDFTWEAFLDAMIESGDTTVRVQNKTLEDCGDSSKCIRIFFGDGSRDNACVEYGFPD